MIKEETTLQSKVSPSDAGKSLLDYLSGRFRYHNRAEWEALIGEGRVLLNGVRVSPSAPLKGRDVVSFTTVLKEPPVNRNIVLLYQDDDFLVVNKPPHLPCHADGNFIKNTLIYILREELSRNGYRGSLHLAHRLDRETSGIVILLKNPKLVTPVMNLFAHGTVSKEYLAVVRGQMVPDTFSVEGYIVPDTGSSISIRRRLSPEPVPEGEKTPSRTDFIVLSRFPDTTLVLARPHTGRTNQIRIHLDAAGCPILGDKLYGKTDEEFLAFVRHARGGGDPFHFRDDEPGRHLLHAWRIHFPHPVTGEPLLFEASLPDDMAPWGPVPPLP